MKYFFLYLLFLLHHFGFAQTPLPKIIEIGESDGLFLSDEIADVKVDKDGFVWIISFSEIVKYDGTIFKEIKTNDIEHSSFLKFNETFDGRKYVGDLDGAVFFIEDDKIIPYRNNNILVAANKTRRALDTRFLPNGKVIATPHSYGIIEINQENESIHKHYNFCNTIKFQKDDIPILIKQGKTKIDKRSRINRTIKFELRDEDSNKIDSIYLTGNVDSYFRSIVKLPNDNFLISTPLKILLEVSKDSIVNTYKFDFSILNLFVDSYNNLWVSTRSDGVYKYENSIVAENNLVKYFPKSNYIISSEDKERGIWGYSEKGGVIKISKPFTTYLKGKDDIDIISAEKIGIHKNKLYFSQLNNKIGVLNLNNYSKELIEMGATTFQLSSNTDPSYPILNLEYGINSKILWIAQKENVRYFENGVIKMLAFNKFENPKFGNNSIQKIYSHNKDSVYLGTHYNKYFKLKGDSIIYISKPFPEPLFKILSYGDSTLISSNNGIYLDYQNEIKLLKTEVPELAKNFKNWDVFGKSVWISTQNSGVYTYFLDSLVKFEWKGLTPKSASFINLNDSILWMFSEVGSFKIQKPYDSNKVNVYEVLPNVNLTDLDGNGEYLYGGTKKSGILKIDLSALKKLPLTSPELIWNEIYIDTKKMDITCSKFSINYNHNNFKVYYSGINYDDLETNYRYRLKGYQEGWVSTIENKIEYYNLPSGEFELELQVRRGEQIWSPSKNIEIEILPPIWKRTWFVLVAFTLFGLIWFFIIRAKIKSNNREKRLEISRLKAEQKALRAKMDPHFVFNVISSLQYLVSNNLNEKASQFLEQFSSLMRTTLDQTSTEFVTLKDEINFLSKYMEMEKLRLEGKFDFSIQLLDGCDENLQIPNFLIQSFIENSIHHGIKLKEGKGKILIKITSKGAYIIVIIEDNGIGLNTTMNAKKGIKSNRKSYGIETVRKRLFLRNGNESVDIVDLSETELKTSGTRVTIKIKIENK